MHYNDIIIIIILIVVMCHMDTHERYERSRLAISHDRHTRIWSVVVAEVCHVASLPDFGFLLFLHLFASCVPGDLSIQF